MPALEPLWDHQKFDIPCVRDGTNDSFFDHAVEICLILGQQHRNIRLAVLSHLCIPRTSHGGT